MSIYTIKGPWKGGLAIISRPRGGDWLEDEVREWKNERMNAVVSLLTNEEQREFDLLRELECAEQHGLTFISLPIIDLGVPTALEETFRTLSKVEALLTSGQNVGIHCRQGIGRSSLIAAALLVMSGATASEAVDMISESRGLPVPETLEQRKWVSDFENELAPAAALR